MVCPLPYELRWNMKPLTRMQSSKRQLIKAFLKKTEGARTLRTSQDTTLSVRTMGGHLPAASAACSDRRFRIRSPKLKL